MTVHSALTGAELHDTKGMDSLVAGSGDVGKAAVSKGDGTSEVRRILPSELGTAEVQSRMGMWDYNDLATTATPIVLTPNDTYVQLTNDELGASTNKTYLLVGVADLWEESTDQFDFSDLSLGDVVDIRFDFTVTTQGANHELAIQLAFGIGDAGAYEIPIYRENFKNSGTFRVVFMMSVYMGDTTTKDFPAEVRMKSDTGTTDECVVNGWFIEATTRSNY